MIAKTAEYRAKNHIHVSKTDISRIDPISVNVVLFRLQRIQEGENVTGHVDTIILVLEMKYLIIFCYKEVLNRKSQSTVRGGAAVQDMAICVWK